MSHPASGLRSPNSAAACRICFVGLVLSSLAAGGCGGTSPGVTASNPSAAELPVVRADVLTIEPGIWPVVVRTQGSLTADEVSIVGAKVAGRVSKVDVDLGDAVKEGDPLVALDQEEFRLQVSQAEAQLSQARAAVGLQPGNPVEKLDRKNAPPVRQEQALWDEAKANLERSRQLRGQNAITTADFEQVAAAERVAEARYQSALNAVDEKIALIGVREAELSLARQNLHDAVVHAPFDGLIQQRQVAPGMYVQVGQSIVTLVRTNPLRFRGTIPERHAQQLAVGQQVRLAIESIPGPRIAAVTRVSPALNEMSRALLFEANVENADGRLRTGLFAEAELVLDPQARAIVVPASSVVTFAGTEKVWKVVDGKLEEAVVETGRSRGTQVEITSGLVAGDRILVDGSEGRVARIEPRNLPLASLPDIGESLPTDGQSSRTDAEKAVDSSAISE